jgi:purine-binding chemotaxis protein CheW
MKEQIMLKDYKTLILLIGQEEYGIHINHVVSIERMQHIDHYSDMPPHVLGVITIRDVLTPVVDLRSAITGELLQLTDAMRIIVVRVDEKAIGLVVDAATDVLDLEPNTIQHQNLLETKNVSYLKGISEVDNRLIILLDIEKLLVEATNFPEWRDLEILL